MNHYSNFDSTILKLTVCISVQELHPETILQPFYGL